MNIARKDILLALILCTSFAWAQEDFDNSNPTISNVFDRGPLLVYDCNGQNTVCASEDSFKYCSGYNPSDKPCKLIKKFETNDKCNDFQLKIVTDNYDGRFCDFY